MSRSGVLDDGRRARLRARLDGLDSFARARWGRMTAHEMICHLSDSLRFALGGRDAGPFRYPLPAWLARFVALSTPFPWPKGAPTPPRIDQSREGTPPVDFEADRTELESLLERFARREGEWPIHPLMGRLDRAQWGTWAWRHFDHHLRQFGG